MSTRDENKGLSPLTSGELFWGSGYDEGIQGLVLGGTEVWGWRAERSQGSLRVLRAVLEVQDVYTMTPHLPGAEICKDPLTTSEQGL